MNNDIYPVRCKLQDNSCVRRMRGVAVMLVIIAMVMCTVLAMSFLSAHQTSTAIAMNVRNESLARAAAESGLDLTAEYVRANHDWRARFNEGIWIENEPFGGGAFSVAVYDLMDNDFTNDIFHPAVITSIGRVDNVSHTSRARIRPYRILVGHWKLDEPAGSTVIIDQTGSHPGTYMNGPVLGQAGVDGSCPYFSGVITNQKYGLIPDSPDFKLNNGTIACWFKTERTNTAQGIVSRDTCFFDQGGGHFMVWLENGGGLCSRIQSTSGSESIDAYPVMGNVQINRWYHVASSWGRGGFKLYVDGVLIGEKPGVTYGIYADTIPFMIGATGFTNCFNNPQWEFKGWIDDVRLYRDQLTEAEVAELATIATAPQPNLGRWDFEETGGTAINDSVAGRNGTLYIDSEPVEYDQPGQVGRSMKFPAWKQYIQVDHGGVYNVANGSVTIWFKPRPDQIRGYGNSLGGMFAMDRLDPNDGDLTVGVRCINDTQCVAFARLQDVAACGGEPNKLWVESTTVMDSSQFHHVVFTFGSGGMKLYLDGVLEDTYNYFGGAVGTMNPLVLSTTNWRYPDSTQSSHPFGGHIDDIGFFDYELTTDQVQQVYNGSLGLNDPEFVRYNVRYEAD